MIAIGTAACALVFVGVLWFRENANWVLDPATRTYWKPVMHGSARRIVRNGGPPLLSREEGRTCKDLGLQKLNGRMAHRWEIHEPKKDGRTFVWEHWEDPRLRTVVRTVRPGIRTYELKNLREGAQHADLFAVPAGYTLVSAPDSDNKGSE